MTRAARLAAELLRERYGPPPTREARTTPADLTRSWGGPDTPAAIAERRRLLCAALDGDHLTSRPDRYARRSA